MYCLRARHCLRPPGNMLVEVIGQVIGHCHMNNNFTKKPVRLGWIQTGRQVSRLWHPSTTGWSGSRSTQHESSQLARNVGGHSEQLSQIQEKIHGSLGFLIHCPRHCWPKSPGFFLKVGQSKSVGQEYRLPWLSTC